MGSPFFHQLVASAKSNLLLRLSDTYVPVLEAVYGSPSTLLDTVSDARSILDSVLSLVTNPTTSKAVVRTHLAFLAGPFVNRYPEYATEIVQKAFFGFLLVTKPRQVMASNAWEVLAESAALGEHELVKGVAGEVVKKLAVATEEKHRLQAESDEFVVERLARASFPPTSPSGFPPSKRRLTSVRAGYDPLQTTFWPHLTCLVWSTSSLVRVPRRTPTPGFSRPSFSPGSSRRPALPSCPRPSRSSST